MSENGKSIPREEDGEAPPPEGARPRLATFLSRKENVYLVLALVFGMAMAVLNPPFDGVPDEHSHFYKAWAVAQGNIRCSSDDTIPRNAYLLPLEDFPVRVDIPGAGKKIAFRASLAKLFEQSPDDPVREGRSLCSANPLGYLPLAFGLRVGKLFHLSALATFYLARIFNLLVSVSLIYLAIRVIPFGKILILILGLLPMTIQQCASVNYDPMHIALSFLFVAYVVRLASVTDAPLRSREMALLFVIGLGAFNAKYGYLGLGLLVFMLPAARFGSRLRYWLSTTGFMAVNALLSYAIYSYFQVSFLRPADYGGGLPGVNMSQQMAHVTGSPLNFFYSFITTLYANMTFYMESFLYKPGWLTHSLPVHWYLFLLAGIVLLIRNESEAVPLTGRQRHILLAVFLVNLVVIFLLLYLGWTKVGEYMIQGVQGRYLIGIFPLLLLFFYKYDEVLTYAFVRKHLQAFLFLFYLAVFGGAFVSLYHIYYDKQPTVPMKEQIVEKLFGHD